ncbi:hypothetical protein AX14_003739 [Amanita brunnescens Koide BX004]|nr:hypothetical protein AX14_003739 [Amanita brunnescens Koide BX004]
MQIGDIANSGGRRDLGTFCITETQILNTSTVCVGSGRLQLKAQYAASEAGARPVVMHDIQGFASFSSHGTCRRRHRHIRTGHRRGIENSSISLKWTSLQPTWRIGTRAQQQFIYDSDTRTSYAGSNHTRLTWHLLRRVTYGPPPRVYVQCSNWVPTFNRYDCPDESCLVDTPPATPRNEATTCRHSIKNGAVAHQHEEGCNSRIHRIVIGYLLQRTITHRHAHLIVQTY